MFFGASLNCGHLWRVIAERVLDVFAGEIEVDVSGPVMRDKFRVGKAIGQGLTRSMRDIQVSNIPER